LTVILAVNGSLTGVNKLRMIGTAGSENRSRWFDNEAWLKEAW